MVYPKSQYRKASQRLYTHQHAAVDEAAGAIGTPARIFSNAQIQV